MSLLLKASQGLPPGVYHCKSRSDWDSLPFSQKSYEAKKAKLIKNEEEGYIPSAYPLEKAYSSPDRFPCIAIEGPWLSQAHDPSGFAYAFLYDIAVSAAPISSLN